MGCLLHKEHHLLDINQRVIMHVPFTTRLVNTLHLHATHVFLVIGVDELPY